MAAGSGIAIGIGCPLGPRTYEFSKCGYTIRIFGECDDRRNGEPLDLFGLPAKPKAGSSKCDGLVCLLGSYSGMPIVAMSAGIARAGLLEMPMLLLSGRIGSGLKPP